MSPNWVVFASIAVLGPQARVPVDLHQGLTVSSQRQRYEVATGTALYEGNVRATNLDLTIVADRVVVTAHEGQTLATADGNVKITDPDGEVTADSLSWDWVNGKGQASNVVIRVGRAMVVAQSVVIAPEQWQFLDVSVSTCAAPKPIYEIKAPKITVTPGKRGVASGVSLWLFGNRLGALPSYRVSLDRRASDLRLPRVGLSDAAKPSLGWSQSAFVGDQLVVGVGGEWEEGFRPAYEGEIRWSPIPTNRESSDPRPYGDLSNRYPYGFFDTTSVQSPEVERKRLSENRGSVTLGTYWSQKPTGRLDRPSLDKPFDLALESGGEALGVVGFIQTRFQRISDPGDKDVDRVATMASLLLPEWKLGRGISAFARMDGGFYTGGEDMAWGQVQTGLIVRPSDGLDLGVAWVEGSQTGTEDYAFDRLFSTQAIHVRFDSHKGPTQVGLLGKFDTNRQSWYDYQIRLSQVAGCVEPFMSYRKFPSSFSFGVNLRLDDLLEVLDRRSRPTPEKDGK